MVSVPKLSLRLASIDELRASSFPSEPTFA